MEFRVTQAHEPAWAGQKGGCDEISGNGGDVLRRTGVVRQHPARADTPPTAGAASQLAYSGQPRKAPDRGGYDASTPAPGSDPGGMSRRPKDTDNPDNMPIKRPDSKTNDRILHDRLPSDAIAR
ncbi:hypothetical protein DFQ28_010987 [Apophysomyces sp. BC1034]|nr:hypothetical protein DFQ28_010987 [Apophysomyces sp. BC1034]